MDISFGSTYRIPISQPGIGKGQKDNRVLHKFVLTFPNGLAPNGKAGWCRVSVPEEQDAIIESGLKKIGYKIWQKFNLHNLNKSKIDEVLKPLIKSVDYKMHGKNPPAKEKPIQR